VVAIQDTLLKRVTQPLSEGIEGEVAEPERVTSGPLLLSTITRIYTCCHIRIFAKWRSSRDLPTAIQVDLGILAADKAAAILGTSLETV
jgi:hypothetical protein